MELVRGENAAQVLRRAQASGEAEAGADGEDLRCGAACASVGGDSLRPEAGEHLRQ